MRTEDSIKRRYTLWIFLHSVLNLILGGLSCLWGAETLWVIGVSASFLSFLFITFPTYKHLPFKLGYPNLITLFRVGLLLILFTTFSNRSPMELFWFSLIIVAFDGVDGFLARKLDQCTEYGGILDAETDAQLVFFLSYIHYTQGTAGAWILIPGGLRYLIQLGFFWLPVVDYPPKIYRATVAVVFFFSLVFSFILDREPAFYVLLIASVLIFISFGLSTYGGLRTYYARKD